MSPPLVLPLQDCHDPSLVGGKALGLAQLMAGGFPVPTGVCITTAAYHAALGAAGFSPLDRWQQALEHTGDVRRAWLADCRSMVRGLEVTALVDACLTAMRNVSGTEGRRWAVRSSSTNEDAAGMGFAGQYRTELGVATQTMSQAITAVWASIWEEHVLDYAAKAGTSQAPPAMAVVCQPMLAAQRAGVAYSIHPVTGRDNHITINAVRGLGAALVDGSVSPDQYVVETGADGEPIRVRRRCLGHQSDRLVLTAEGVRTEPVPGHERDRDSLADPELFELARVVKRIERAGHGPVDVEWAIEAGRLWVLQARPITAVRPSSELTDDECEWSRTNFKETMPELPSPLGISFLERFMAAYIVAHYRRLGCRIPPGLSSVRTLFGRPYINLTLFHSLVGQLRGDPSMNVEQMGGEPLRSVPAVRPLGVRAMVRALWLVWREMRRVVRESPRNFAQMKQMAATYSRDRLASYPLAELGAELDGIGRWLDEHEVTFGIAAGVGQCLQTFSLLLPRWLGDDWRSLLNAALQGQGTVISAQQIIRLAELAELARHDDRVLRALEQGASDYRACRSLVQGTPFLSAFDRYVDDYGHRGLGESDVMSPRFGEQPEVVLGVIRTQLRGPASTPADIVERQRVRRERALAEIRARCGWRVDRWLVFRWWYRRLCLFFSLREANRHHLMWYATAVRNVLLQIGERLVEQGRLAAPEDMFFLTLQERADLLQGASQDWTDLIVRRRADRERWVSMQVPDTIRDWDEAVQGGQGADVPDVDGQLRGLPISTGMVTGPVTLIRSAEDWSRVRPGDIIVAPVIDPGMAPLFGIAAGLIVEMGGTLSHGAIIAREYGLPALVNVPRVMRQLRDGDRIQLDASHGTVRKIVP